MKESGLVRTVSELLRGNGWWVYKIHGNSWSRVGVPDLILLKDGVTIWTELKLPGEKPTKVQEVTMEEIRRFGGNANWSDSAIDVLVKATNIHDEELTWRMKV
jgi:Holliday junction resolvase